MTAKVLSLDTKAGIQRDGTVFDKQFYSDGQWVRFQRGRPRKVGGYSAVTNAMKGPSRGIWVNALDATNYVFSGYSDGLQVLQMDDNGIGAGVSDFTLSNFTASPLNMWQMDAFFDVGGGTQSLLAHPGQNLSAIDNETNTPVLIGDITGTIMSKIGVFSDANAYLNSTNKVALSQVNTLIGAGQVVTGSGIPASTSVVSTTLVSPVLSNVAVTGTGGTFSCANVSGLYVGQSVSVSGSLGSKTLSGVTITGTSGTFSCTTTTGLYTGQEVIVSGTVADTTLASVAFTGPDGTFSCTTTTGLAVGQPVTVSGTINVNTLTSVAITNVNGEFSCSTTTGLYVGQPIFVSGTQAAATLAAVTVTGTGGQCSCTATSGLYVGQPISVTGTLTGTATGISTNSTYYIIATDGTSTFTLSATEGGAAITTTAGTTTGLTFKTVLLSGVQSNSLYYIIATNGTSTFTLSDAIDGQAINTNVVTITGLVFKGPVGVGVQSGQTYYITATNGTSTFTLSTLPNGPAITNTFGATTGLTFKTKQFSGVTSGTTYYITTTNGTSTFTLSATPGGTAITTVVTGLANLVFTVPNSIGLTSGTTYYIIATNNISTFTLSATPGGSAVTTVVTSTAGFTFTLGQFQQLTLSNAATSTGASTLTFDNQVSVSGGVVSLHPYVFVYGNDGLIKNCSAGNPQDWVSADANEVNVASGKIVQGLPVRGGSNAPSGLFWSLDSLIRVSYIGGTGTPAQYWRYDIISSQSSILSSQCAIEYDGIYYWIGVDRFLLYNGTVKEIPNVMNQNYFFDNLNYNQRQKVWATKVPRYGEIWWFYPRGDATECTDAIIYNVRENTWYDAGSAPGARRSAGFFSQVFSRPVAADWDTTEEVEVTSGSFVLTNGNPNIYSDTYDPLIALTQVADGTGIASGSLVLGVTTSNIKTLGAITAGSGYVDNTYTNVPLTGGSGGGATANITVSGTAVTAVTIVDRGAAYQIGDVLSASNTNLGGAGAGFSIPVSTIYLLGVELSANATSSSTQTVTFFTQPGLVSLYQHEIGTDAVNGQSVEAILSYFETNDLGWVSGGPAQPSPIGENRWLRLERVEPDFLQSGEIELYITGRPYAQSQDDTTGPYTFTPSTNKIDMKEQRRELRLKFVSNVAGGDYQLGRVLLNADFGDVRGY